MANASLPYLAEHRLVTQFTGEEWLGSLTIAAATGNYLPSWPLLIFQFDGAVEQPVNYGNYMMDIHATLTSGMDPDSSTDYASVANSHNTLAAHIHNKFTEITPAQLTGGFSSGFDNCLTSYHFKIKDMARDIEKDGGVLEDTWELEMYGFSSECS